MNETLETDQTLSPNTKNTETQNSKSRELATKKETSKVWRGYSFPLGSQLKKDGVNFAISAELAEKVELCLFDADGNETARFALPDRTNKIWHGFVPGLKAGQHYGYRVYGPYEPTQGMRFNANKLLIDPYAKAISGPIKWNEAVFPYKVGDPAEDLSFDERDSAPFMPKSVVVNDAFDWEGTESPRVPWHETVIYEMHVKGFSMLNSAIPEKLRGTYSGVAHPTSIKYLKELGITSVELLPIQQFVEDDYLHKKDLHNYWGYSTIGFFAPEWRYSGKGRDGGQVSEFKTMVKALHEAGIEVILDVVYNHTAEGNHMGPMLSFRGIDNPSYYRLVPDDLRHYMDYTGCGNTLNVTTFTSLRMMVDSLRYWVSEMHVDGFRFDLASALARGLNDVDQLNSFFGILQQDPLLSQVKLIAEPWDLGAGGYQVGQFPDHWAEWNDKYRDTTRAFWKGEGGLIGDLAYRLTGSSDLYEHRGRRPYASINFITAHDGFTLNDLVSYNGKHNEANKEENRDGNDNNVSWNCGAEGPTDDPAILKLRAQQKRNFLSTLLLSQGIPMLVAGDEIGRTQGGNNNAYCQDNEISWTHWDDADKSLLEFTKKVIATRNEHRVFHRRNFFQGKSLRGSQKTKDIVWLMPTGQEMSDEAWDTDYAKCVGIHFGGAHLDERDKFNSLLEDDNFIWLLNASHVEIDFQMPSQTHAQKWNVVFDTAADDSIAEPEVDMKMGFKLQPRASVLLINKRKLS